MSTVVVTETCANCGTEVPRQLTYADTEPRVTVMQVVFCPRCGLEQSSCVVTDCMQPMVATIDAGGVCKFHALCAEIAGLDVRRPSCE